MCWQGLTGTRRAFIEGATAMPARRRSSLSWPRCRAAATLDAQGVNAGKNSVPRRVGGL